MKRIFLPILLFLGIVQACEDKYGANPYDPTTKITVSRMPKISAFAPTDAKKGDTVQIYGINFTSAGNVIFGGKKAVFFSIESDTLIKAVVGDGTTGVVSVTNAHGTKSLEGFVFIPDVPPAETGNLALNKPATASPGGNAPGLSNDGDDATRWFSAVADNQWWRVDLSAAHEVNRVVINWEGAYATDYQIQVSTDDVNYTTVFATDEGAGGNVEIEFEPASARYVRLALHKRIESVWAFSFWEVEVYTD